VIAQVAATAAPPFVTVAVPRELRIDPCEKEVKRGEVRRVAPRSIGGRGRGCHWHTRGFNLILFSGKTGAKFLRKIRLSPKNANEVVGGWNSRVFKSRRGVCLSSNNV
jgi:hypothetical protein